MSDVTKTVDRGISANERTQNFTQVDAGAGDILLIKASLGRPARTLQVESVGGMTFRMNTRRTIFPLRTLADGLADNYDNVPQQLALPQVINDTTGALVTLAAGETFNLDAELPVSDISIITVSGNFDIFVA